MDKQFNLNVFSSKSIRELQRQLESYKDGLVIKCRLVAERLAEEGVEIARMQVVDLDAVFTSELLQSIHSEYGGSNEYGATFFVKADSTHAAFVEYGTGIVGKQYPYKGELPQGVSWEYVSGKQLIRNIQNGIYGWFYPGKDGNWYFTQGMPSRPFMTNTAEELYQKVYEVVQEVFKD